MVAHIERIGPGAAAETVDGLAELLVDAVAGGASVGFLSPFGMAEARRWWRQAVISRLEQEATVLLVARHEGRLAGTVQLRAASYPNGRHRAELAKLLVHSRHRRRGLASALMEAADAAALASGWRLLVLDTLTGSPAQQLYSRLGWQVSGVIPGYALLDGGGAGATTIMYKRLAHPAL